MDQEQIQQQFLTFAQPLAMYVQLGGRKEAMEDLARNLWAALLAGPAAEAQLWEALDGEVDGGIIKSIRGCFYEEMKPTVGGEKLDQLRRHYGISLPAENGPGSPEHD